MRALTTIDLGGSTALLASGAFSASGSNSTANIAAWDGSFWFSLGFGLRWNGVAFLAKGCALVHHDDGFGPAVFVGGSFTGAGNAWVSNTARLSSCAVLPPSPASAPQIGLAQPAGPATPVTVLNSNLSFGREYLNLYSLEPCTAVPGSGPLLGLCASSPGALAFLQFQAALPVGTPAVRFIATSATISWGPFSLPSVTIDAVSVDVSGGTLGVPSSVVRLFVQ